MPAKAPITLLLNDEYVDQLWSQLKREGIPAETTKKAAAKVAAKTSFGLGKLAEALTLKAGLELTGEISDDSTSKLLLTPIYRSLLLGEFLDISDTREISELSHDHFARILCENVTVAYIPTFSNFLLAATTQPEKDVEFTVEEAIHYIKNTDFRAYEFKDMIDREGSLLNLLDKRAGPNFSILNAMTATASDHAIVLGQAGFDNDVVVYCIVEERWLNRSLIDFAKSRKVSFEGQVMSYGDDLKRDGVIRLLPYMMSFA